MKNAECRMVSATILHSAFCVLRLVFSRAAPASAIKIVLQQHGSGERIHVCRATLGPPSHLAHRLAHASRRKALVPECDGAPRAPLDGGGEFAGSVRRLAFSARRVEREADHDADDVVRRKMLEQGLHRKTFPGATGQRSERLSESLGLIGEGEPDAAFAPVDGEEAALERGGGPAVGRSLRAVVRRSAGPPVRHPCDIVAKNSWFDLVRFMRSSRNSMASTGGMSARKLRSR